MKEWWSNLNLREKRIVSLGAAAIVIALVYLVLWSPLASSIDNFRDHIKHNQDLLLWMQTADKNIQAIEKIGKKPETHRTASHLSIVENYLKQSPLAKNITQLVQADNDSVKLGFQRVDFDLLMTWLTELWQQQGLIITQFTVKPDNAPGMVTGELILSSA